MQGPGEEQGAIEWDDPEEQFSEDPFENDPPPFLDDEPYDAEVPEEESPSEPDDFDDEPTEDEIEEQYIKELIRRQEEPPLWVGRCRAMGSRRGT